MNHSCSFLFFQLSVLVTVKLVNELGLYNLCVYVCLFYNRERRGEEGKRRGGET